MNSTSKVFGTIKRKISPLFVVFLVLWCGCFLLARTENTNLSSSHFLSEKNVVRKKIHICSDPVKSINSLDSLAYYQKQKVQCLWPYGTEENDIGKLGQICLVSGSITKLADSSYDRSLVSQGVKAKIRIAQMDKAEWPNTFEGHLMHYRSQLIQEILSQSNSMQGGLIAALVFGYKTRLSTLQELFKKIGLSHMLSVSGSHFALAIGFVLFLLRSFDLRRSSLIVVSIVFSVCFYYLTGINVATLRACLMACGTQLMYFSNRRIDLLSLVSGAGILTLLAEPMNAISLSFQLSFAAVIGIALYYVQFVRSAQSVSKYIPSWVRDGFALGLSAQLLTIPITIVTFNSFSPLSVFSTLFTTALFEVVIVAGVLFALISFVSTTLSFIFVGVAKIASDLIVESALALAEIPGMFVMTSSLISLILALAFLLIAIVFFFNDFKSDFKHFRNQKIYDFNAKKVQSAISLIIIFCAVVWLFFQSGVSRSFIFPEKKDDGVYFLNVGQGDATLIKNHGENILIDAGPDELALKRELKKVSALHIDTLIFTHGHEDHVRGAELFSASTGIKQILVAQGTQKDKNIVQIAQNIHAPIYGLLSGETIKLSVGSLKVLSPRLSVVDGDDNSSCLILRYDLKQFLRTNPKFVITGDAEADTLDSVLRDNSIRKIEVLKLGHHGSKKSIDAQTLNETKIKNVIISVGENSYGHPNIQVLKLLKSFSIPYKRTDVSGTIYYRSVAQ